MIGYKKQTIQLVEKLRHIAGSENKLTGFCIGNTAKIDKSGLYFTPIRNISRIVVGGVIVYSEKLAVDIVKLIDGKVDYILADAEKKIPASMSRTGDTANVERAVRETIKKSTLWIYKGNDLAVEAIDCLLTYLTKDCLRGLGGRKVVILGAGNLGSKLALKLVERGANVFITKRNVRKLRIIERGLNCIKPLYTLAKIVGLTHNEKAAHRADILIGLTQGIPVITSEMIKNLAPGAIVIDGGKGTLNPSAMITAYARGINVYRLDISAPFEGLVNELFAIENIIENRLGRKKYHNESIISGGLLGKHEEIIVDNVHDPKVIYGMANGAGDFIRHLTKKQSARIAKVQQYMNNRLKENPR